MNGERLVAVNHRFLDSAQVAKNVGKTTEEGAFALAIAHFTADRQRVFAAVGAPRPTGPVAAQKAKISKDDPLVSAVADLAVDGEGLLEVRSGLLRLSLLLVHEAEITGVGALRATIAHFAVNDNGLFEVRLRFNQPPLRVREGCRGCR